MAVVIKDIDFKKRNKNNYKEDTTSMYSLEKYRDISKKCISRFSGPSYCASMLKSEDAISHVSEHIMWGHIRWDENGGRALKSYLNQCAIWAIKSWKTKVYGSDAKNISSLNYSNVSDGERQTQKYQTISDKKCKEPIDILCDDTTLKAEKILNSSILTPLQSNCLYQRYIEGKKLRQIAESLSVSRQAVNQHIKKAVNKLRKQNDISE